jgi:hypothetical protein
VHRLDASVTPPRRRTRPLLTQCRKRIFLLGPSHHFYLSDCALPPPSIERYATPLGSLRLDAATLASLRATGRFARLAPRDDEAEHSLELHLPYIRKMLAT